MGHSVEENKKETSEFVFLSQNKRNMSVHRASKIDTGARNMIYVPINKWSGGVLDELVCKGDMESSLVQEGV